LEEYLRSHYGDIQKWLPEEKRQNHAPEILNFGRMVTTTESQRISVVMPLYNKAAEVERALLSVVNQSLVPHEVIVVDDGSTDDSAALVEAIIAAHPEVNIRLVRQANGGVSAARMRGVAEASGDYVAFLDADDMWLTGYIAEICRLMEYYPDADAYSTAFDIVSGRKRVAARVPRHEGYIDPVQEALDGRYPIIPSTATLKRSALLAAGGFPIGMRIGEDQWLWVRMVQQGATFCFSPMSLVRYSREASNRSATIYRSEQTKHSFEELYTPEQEDSINEYIARVAIGKAITQSVRGGTNDAQRVIEKFGYTHLSRRQLRRLKLLNSLPRAIRPMADYLYTSLAWFVARRGL
jgi:glycosyltransferase involved in cell wall biosynthesis